jgi:hypothetical protein
MAVTGTCLMLHKIPSHKTVVFVCEKVAVNHKDKGLQMATMKFPGMTYLISRATKFIYGTREHNWLRLGGYSSLAGFRPRSLIFNNI